MTRAELETIIDRVVQQEAYASGRPIDVEALVTAIAGAVVDDIDAETQARHDAALEREIRAVIAAVRQRGLPPEEQLGTVVRLVLALHSAPPDLPPLVVELAAAHVEAVARRLLAE